MASLHCIASTPLIVSQHIRLSKDAQMKLIYDVTNPTPPRSIPAFIAKRSQEMEQPDIVLHVD